MKSRHLTIVTFISLCIVCLVVGMIGTDVLFGRIRRTSYRLEMDSNAQYGERFAAAIQTQLAMGMTAEQVARMLQVSFETSPRDDYRFICLLSADHQVLCHPNPAMLGAGVQDLQILDPESGSRLSYLEWVRRGLTEGLLIEGSGSPSQLLHRIPVNNAPWSILVHRDLRGLNADLLELQRMILMVFIPMGVILVLIGTTVVRLLGRRYEQQIEENNRTLEQRVHARTAELQRTVSELGRARQALILNEKLALIGQLMAGIAHEINSPLSAIQVFSQNLEEEAASDFDRETAARIGRSAQRCSLLVRNLLAFARNEPPIMVPIPVNEVIETVLSFTIIDLRDARVHVEQVLDPANPVLHADRIQIEQVVLNLVNNAAQALKDREPPRHIRITTVAGESQVQLTIEDNGPGVPSQIESTLFEPFHTTKAGGTGLGLSLCRQFVERHGGSIVYRRSDFLGGAAFQIILPRHHSVPSSSSRERLPAATIG